MPDLIQIGIHPSKPAYGCAQKTPPRTRVFWLQGVTLVWMAIEFGVSAYAAITAHSPAMLAFGSDSLVELMSATVVLLQWVPGVSVSERKATRAASILLFVLALVVVGTALASLALRLRPETSRAGICITIAALLAMPVLAWLKRREAHHSGNTALAHFSISRGSMPPLRWWQFLSSSKRVCLHGGDRAADAAETRRRLAWEVATYFNKVLLLARFRVRC